MSWTRCRSVALLLAGAVVLAHVAPPAASAQDLARGEVLFDLCAQCHAVDGGGDRQYLAPAIAGMAEWAVLTQLKKFRDGQRGTHFDDISGMRMRPMALTLRSDEDVAAVAAYVASLPDTNPEPELVGADLEKGKVHYALCASCHGPDADGMQPMNAPRLRHTNDWYLVDQLKKFKAGVRGSDPKDPIAIMMRPMSLGLDEQAMKDVIAYSLSLSEK